MAWRGHPGHYAYGSPEVEADGGTPATTTGEVEPGDSMTPHTPPANVGTVSPPGGSASVESGKQPTLTSIAPNTAVVGGADLTMTCTGTNFAPSSRILWNGVPENTTYVSATEVSTVVKPSTASGAGTVPVQVANGVNLTAPQTFTFTAT